MNNLIKLFLIIIAFSQTSFLSAEEFQYENRQIECIEVIMMHISEGVVEDSNAVQARIKSRIGGYFSQADFDNDLKILSQDFDRIEPIVECINGRIYVTLKIWPKPNIRTITWCGNSKIPSKTLASELGIGRCSLFDRCAFNQAFHKLKEYYVKQGFFEAELNYTICSDPHTNEVDIQVTIEEGRAGRVKEIRFINFTSEEESEILSQMGTQEYSFLTSWLNDAGTFREEVIQQDELAIVNYLQNIGYADARVNVTVTEIPQSNRIVVTIEAEKGCIYRIGQVNWEGNTLICDEDIQKCLLFAPGQRYSPENIRDSMTRISDLYGKYGYIDAFINYEPKLNCDEFVYDIDLTIEEGEQYRIGLIKVYGNFWTQTSVILHETLLIPGEVFNIQKLKITEDRLQNIGFFECVNVYAVKSDDPCDEENHYRDVHIEVEEASTGHFGTFFGFSTNESLFGGINITESNFNYKGLNCLFSEGLGSLRGGGEYLHATATLGTKSRSYVLSWSKPYFCDTPWIVGFDLERTSNRYVSNDYDFETSSLTLRGLYPINAYVRVGLHYRIKYTHINMSHDLHGKLEEEAKNSGLLSGLGGSWVYDSTNHPLFPTCGYKSRFEGEVANLTCQRMFFNVGYINTYYFQLKPWDCKGIWKIRWDAKFIQPLLQADANKIPLDERLYLGGDWTVRGYRPYRLGAKFPHSDDPRGGMSLQFLSLEYSFPIWSRVEMFCFADAGHISLKTWNFGRFDVAVGYGLKIPIFDGAPPLVVGYGFPLHPRRKTDIKRFFISVGGRF